MSGNPGFPCGRSSTIDQICLFWWVLIQWQFESPSSLNLSWCFSDNTRPHSGSSHSPSDTVSPRLSKLKLAEISRATAKKIKQATTGSNVCHSLKNTTLCGRSSLSSQFKSQERELGSQSSSAHEGQVCARQQLPTSYPFREGPTKTTGRMEGTTS